MSPPDKQPAAETLEEIAGRILIDGIDCTGRVFESRMKLAILSALRNERERCAKVAKRIPDSRFDLDHEPARTEQQIRNGIARAIREGK